MKKYIYSTFIAASLLFTSCEEVVELNLDQHEKRVIIDANLFLGENDYNSIKLSYSSPFYSEAYSYISNATVQLTNSSTNEIYPFIYISNGNYVNTTFNPDVNDSYDLEIIIEGNVYKATSKVWQAPVIENIQQINDTGFSGDSYELGFYFQDDASTEDFYLIQTIDNKENDFSVSNDQFTNGNLIRDIYFADKEQQGETIFYGLAKIDKGYYNYLSKLFSNAASAGNPFATPTGTVKGNIINVTNENEFPLGYFHISKRNTTTYTIQ